MKISIIIPVHNGGDDFEKCLEAISASTESPNEIIVVNDASSDDSAQIANRFGAQVLNMGNTPMGPAAARNRGAASAEGDILVFIDADVAVHPDTLSLIAKKMAENPGISAIFGSYDDTPSKKGYVSNYKNLQHHYVHQHSPRVASTFWAGCGAIYRDVFLKMGGFNECYVRPSIEDIELGMRLNSSGYHIWLCPDIQVKHLKLWTLPGLLRSDIMDRAIPWSKLLIYSPHIPLELNLNLKSRLSALSIWLSLLLLALGFYHPTFWLISILCLGILFFLNLGLYKLFFARGGVFLFIIGTILHWIYYLHSSFIFTIFNIHRLIINIQQKIERFALNRQTIRGKSNE